MKDTRTALTLKNNDIRRFASDSALNFIRVMFENADGAKEGEDIEHLHDMRVASRRLRECFQLFGSFYATKKTEKILARVKKVTRILGIPREMDVNVSVLEAYKPKRSPVVQTTHEYLLEIFEFEQARYRKKMLKAFDKLDLKLLESDLTRFAQTAIAKSPNSHLLADARQDLELEAFLDQTTHVLQEKIAPILAFGSSPASQISDDDVLHRLRINIKKSRYCFEILNPLHAGRFEKAIELAKQLQEILGKIHDLAVLTGRLNTHRIHLMEKTRSHLAKGCQEIVADLGELKQSLLPQVEPAHKRLVDELGQLLPLESQSAAVDPTEMAMEKSSQEASKVERRDENLRPDRPSDLLSSTQSEDQATTGPKSGAARRF